MMINWNNLHTIQAYQELSKTAPVDLAEVMAGESGADRVKKYTVPMGAGLAFNYAAKQVDDEVLAALEKLAEETQLTEKFEALYKIFIELVCLHRALGVYERGAASVAAVGAEGEV